MIKINNPYSFLPAEETIIRTNSPRKGDDWGKGIFDSIKKNIKEHLLSEQDRTCPYCGLRLPKWGMFPSIEHIAHKGIHYRFMFESKNLIVTCTTCNVYKGDKETLVNPTTATYPSIGDDFLIIHPHFDDYFQHIEITCGVLLKAVTDKGLRTIEYCKLNKLALAEERMEQKKIDLEEIHKKMILQLFKEDNPDIKRQILDFLDRA
jgi:uncharacterized protein (TIGR02646 family)